MMQPSVFMYIAELDIIKKLLDNNTLARD